MNIKDTETLIVLMRHHGVSYLKNTELEIKMDGIHTPDVVSKPPRTTNVVKKSEPQQSFSIEPTNASEVPPTEIQIPHHENKVQSLLRLNDEQLVDVLFPEGAPPHA